MAKLCEEQVWEGKIEFRFGHAEFEMPRGHSNRDLKVNSVHRSPKFAEEVSKKEMYI